MAEVQTKKMSFLKHDLQSSILRLGVAQRQNNLFASRRGSVTVKKVKLTSPFSHEHIEIHKGGKKLKGNLETRLLPWKMKEKTVRPLSMCCIFQSCISPVLSELKYSFPKLILKYQ